MGKNTKRIEVIDPETGETFGVNVGMMVSDLRDIFISWRRNVIASTSWSALSEDQQRDAIVHATNLAEDIVVQCVDLIAAQGRDVIHAQLDNFKIKAGTVTLTAKGLADDEALLALNRVGSKALKIIVADAEQFDQQREEMRPDPDQPSMPLDEPPGKIGLTDQEVEDIGSEMDAQLDDMDDTMHDDSGPGEGSVELPPEAPDPHKEGQAARLSGKGKDDCPHDGGTDEHIAWVAGWDDADRQIADIKAEGAQAFAAGKDGRANPWKKDSDGHRLWVEGFNAAKLEAVNKKATHDAHAEGVEASKRGDSIDTNPYPEGDSRRRFWLDGYASGRPIEDDSAA